MFLFGHNEYWNIFLFLSHSYISLNQNRKYLWERREKDWKSNLQGQDGSFWNVEIPKDTTSFPYFHCTGDWISVLEQYSAVWCWLWWASKPCCWLLNILILKVIWLSTGTLFNIIVNWLTACDGWWSMECSIGYKNKTLNIISCAIVIFDICEASF